ncbi:hypothetical protein VNO77_03047 [Canavalia gladiata]|uniref:Uncharacterized protein n=1 Tax=Canavalia gladiata TaxID=3824 RepID=A0AAN9RBV3_CANGL
MGERSSSPRSRQALEPGSGFYLEEPGKSGKLPCSSSSTNSNASSKGGQLRRESVSTKLRIVHTLGDQSHIQLLETANPTILPNMHLKAPDVDAGLPAIVVMCSNTAQPRAQRMASLHVMARTKVAQYYGKYVRSERKSYRRPCKLQPMLTARECHARGFSMSESVHEQMLPCYSLAGPIIVAHGRLTLLPRPGFESQLQPLLKINTPFFQPTEIESAN